MNNDRTNDKRVFRLDLFKVPQQRRRSSLSGRTPRTSGYVLFRALLRIVCWEAPARTVERRWLRL